MKRLYRTWRWTLAVVACAAVAALFLMKRPGRMHRLEAWTNQMASTAVVKLASPSWKRRLYTPTFLTRIGALYFIVDCWHNRVLYSPDLGLPVERWHTLDDDLAGPHSIASDSVLYVVDDTGRNGVRVYTHHGDSFQLVQTLSDLGGRTHRVRYDADTSAFYVLASTSQQVTKLARQGERLQVVYTKDLPFLNHRYTRSFVILDGFMYFNSGPGRITQVQYKDDSYEAVETFPVPAAAYEMNDLFRSGTYLYITATPKAILRTTSFEALRRGQWEDVYNAMDLHGTPYYLSAFDGRIFVPQASGNSSIKSFIDRGGAIADLRTLMDGGPPTWLDRRVRSSLPK